MSHENNPSIFSGPQRPVENVSWYWAQRFIVGLNDLLGFDRNTGRHFRLPTEAEWEYAAKNAKEGKYPLFSGSDDLREIGWYKGNSHGETKNVGKRLPTLLGIHDMSGNVYEWCEDWYSETTYGQYATKESCVNPWGPDSGAFRIVRGGNWTRKQLSCQNVYRNYHAPGFRDGFVGFRLALSIQSIGQSIRTFL